MLLVVRRRLTMALVLLPAPIAFIVFMGDQQRFFGRWLMPIFPIVALLGAYATVELVRWLVRTRRVPVLVAAGVAAVVMLGQGLATVDPQRRRAVASGHPQPDPAVDGGPRARGRQGGDRAGGGGQLGHRRRAARCPATASGARWQRYPTWETNVDANGNPLPAGEHRYVAVDQYERTLRPALLTQYSQDGYCWVVIGSLQAGRSFAQPKVAPRRRSPTTRSWPTRPSWCTT